ncbi:MAG: VTT domain-containing protein [Eubacteriales bacterium]|nr:VTT domain-containing protein [Eubacteriales bacterium]
MRQPNPARRNNFLRVLVLVAAFAVVVTISLLSLNAILPGFSDVLQRGDQQELVRYIRGFGSVGGVVLAFLLQFIQIISIFFPGGPIQIAIGVVFGTLWGFVICHVGYVLANIAVFFSARKLGNRLDQLFSRREASESRFRFLTDSQHPSFMVALACLIPMLPNGLVPYIAARTKITSCQFLLSVYLGSIPTLLMLNAIGNKLLQGDYTKVALLGVLLVVGVTLLYAFRKHIFSLVDRIHLKREERASSKPE